MTENSSRKTRILWAGKRRADIPSFVPNLEARGYKVTFVTTGKDAVLKLNRVKPDVMVVDAASMRTTGSRICKSVQAKGSSVPIILINCPDNLPTNEIVADVQLVLPFTIRKLENRIIPFRLVMAMKYLKPDRYIWIWIARSFDVMEKRNM